MNEASIASNKNEPKEIQAVKRSLAIGLEG